jgi:hypothetical protein
MTTWPGKDLGVRQPQNGETPLSDQEVLILVRLMLSGEQKIIDLFAWCFDKNA